MDVPKRILDSSFAKKLVIGVSAFFAFLISLIGVYEFLMKPSGPKIEIIFALSGSTEIAIAPTVQSRKSDWTDPFPLGLQIVNVGDDVAIDVNISLESSRNLVLTSNEIELNPQLIFNKDGLDLASHQLKIPKINPGQTIHLDNKIFGYTENYIDKDFEFKLKDGIDVTLPISIFLIQTIEADITASNMEKMKVNLKLKIGDLESLSNDDTIKHFFQYKDKKILKYN